MENTAIFCILEPGKCEKVRKKKIYIWTKDSVRTKTAEWQSVQQPAVRYGKKNDFVSLRLHEVGGNEERLGK